MAIWNYHVSTDLKPIRLEDAERALQEADPDFYLDGDVIVLRNGLGGEEELECAQIQIETVNDPIHMPDRQFFEEWISGKRSHDHLRSILDHAESVVALQLLNTEFWWNNDPDRTLRALQDWLIETFEGALFVEGSEIHDRTGLVD